MADSDKLKMTNAQMRQVIENAKSGDRFKLAFTKKTFEGDLRGRLYFILGMQGKTLQMKEGAFFTLQAVADSGRWEGCDTYEIEVLDGFDPDWFYQRTVGRELLESIEHL